MRSWTLLRNTSVKRNSSFILLYFNFLFLNTSHLSSRYWFMLFIFLLKKILHKFQINKWTIIIRICRFVSLNKLFLFTSYLFNKSVDVNIFNFLFLLFIFFSLKTWFLFYFQFLSYSFRSNLILEKIVFRK